MACILAQLGQPSVLQVPAGSTVKCSTFVASVEDRKIWMNADLTNGHGIVYASARALFVAPRITKMLFGWLPEFGRQEA